MLRLKMVHVLLYLPFSIWILVNVLNNIPEGSDNTFSEMSLVLLLVNLVYISFKWSPRRFTLPCLIIFRIQNYFYRLLFLFLLINYLFSIFIGARILTINVCLLFIIKLFFQNVVLVLFRFIIQGRKKADIFLSYIGILTSVFLGIK